MKTSLAGLMVVASMVLPLGAAVAQSPVTIKAATWTPPKSTLIKDILNPLLDQIERDADGTVKFERYWGGTLGRAPTKQYELVRDGVIDVGWNLVGYTAGQFPESSIFELPYLADSSTEGSIAGWRLYHQGLLTGFDQIHVVGLHTNGPYGLRTRQPVLHLADVKGMKIRMSGPIQAAFLKLLGAAPIGMAPAQMAEALNRGVLDGTLTGWSGVRSFAIQDLTPNHFDAPLGVPLGLVMMHKAAWDKLPPKAKAAFDKDGHEAFARLAGAEFDKSENEVRADITKNPKYNVVRPTPADVQEAKSVVKPIYDDWIAKTPNGKKVFEALESAIADIRLGK